MVYGTVFGAGGRCQQERDGQVALCTSSNSPVGNDLTRHISLGIPPVRFTVHTLLSCVAVTALKKFQLVILCTMLIICCNFIHI